LEGAAAQDVFVDFEVQETVVIPGETVRDKFHGILEESRLCLEMMRREIHPLGPDQLVEPMGHEDSAVWYSTITDAIASHNPARGNI
jgi:hypothetical protein